MRRPPPQVVPPAVLTVGGFIFANTNFRIRRSFRRISRCKSSLCLTIATKGDSSPITCASISAWVMLHVFILHAMHTQGRAAGTGRTDIIGIVEAAGAVFWRRLRGGGGRFLCGVHRASPTP